MLRSGWQLCITGEGVVGRRGSFDGSDVWETGEEGGPIFFSYIRHKEVQRHGSESFRIRYWEPSLAHSKNGAYKEAKVSSIISHIRLNAGAYER